MEGREVGGFVATFPNDGHIVIVRVFDQAGVRIMRTFDDHEVVVDEQGNLWIPKIGQYLDCDDRRYLSRL